MTAKGSSPASSLEFTHGSRSSGRGPCCWPAIVRTMAADLIARAGRCLREAFDEADGRGALADAAFVHSRCAAWLEDWKTRRP